MKVYDLLVNQLHRQSREFNPPWDEGHYQGYSRRELVERTLFLQGAGRRAWVERELLLHVVLPIACFVAVLVGFALGRYG